MYQTLVGNNSIQLFYTICTIHFHQMSRWKTYNKRSILYVGCLVTSEFCGLYRVSSFSLLTNLQLSGIS